MARRHRIPLGSTWPGEQIDVVVRRKPERFPSLVGASLVKLRVDANRSIQVHETLLRAASPGFVFHFNISHGGLDKNSDVELLREDEEMVNVLVAWLYAGPEGSLANIPHQDRFLRLARLYRFAEKYKFPTLQNDIITELFILKAHGDFPPLRVIYFVFTKMKPDSTLANLMIAWHVVHLDLTSCPSVDEMEGVPTFAARVARAHMDKLRNQFEDPFDKGPEHYFVESRLAVVDEPCTDSP